MDDGSASGRLFKNLTVLASVETGCKVGVTSTGDVFVDPPSVLRPLYRRLRRDTAPGTVAAVCAILDSFRGGAHSLSAVSSDGRSLQDLLLRAVVGIRHLAATYAECGHRDLADKLRRAVSDVQAEGVDTCAAHTTVEGATLMNPSSTATCVEAGATLPLAHVIVAGAAEAVGVTTPPPAAEDDFSSSLVRDPYHFPPLARSQVTIPKVLHQHRQQRCKSAAKP
jgi:hypothetical protein